MLRIGALLGIAILLGACASVQSISGGEQDTKAPVLVNAHPPHRSTSFDARAILLEFNERIQLDRVRERMLISPPLDTAPDVRLAGPRSVEIRLNGPLAPNTTYTFNLGESVKDLTEGNIASGLSYVVSTGGALDSAVVMGSVTNALSGAAEKAMIVALYADGDTGAFRTGRPAYMTRSDASGRFTIANLPHGRFSILALRDMNANYRYDLPNEEIAFLNEAIELDPADSTATALDLRSFLPLSAQQQVRSYTISANGALELVFARSADSVSVRDIGREGGSLRWNPEYAPTKDTVLLWPSDTTLLTSGIYEISVGSHRLDTLRYRPTRGMPFNTALTTKLVQHSNDASILLRSSRPVVALDTTRISLHSDSVDIPFRITRTDDRTFALDFATKDGMSVQLLVKPKAVRDVYGGYNDTLRTLFGTAAARTTGSLQVSVAGLEPARNYLLQVLDGQQRVQLESPLSASRPVAQWNMLVPGMRMLRLVDDANDNGRWDTGEWRVLKQPERTWRHDEPVNVRAAWDVKVDWSITTP